VHAIAYSHGHHGYNVAVDMWQQHNADRGDPPIRLVGHALVVKRMARYRETAELQTRMGPRLESWLPTAIPSLRFTLSTCSYSATATNPTWPKHASSKPNYV